MKIRSSAPVSHRTVSRRVHTGCGIFRNSAMNLNWKSLANKSSFISVHQRPIYAVVRGVDGHASIGLFELAFEIYEISPQQAAHGLDSSADFRGRLRRDQLGLARHGDLRLQPQELAF